MIHFVGDALKIDADSTIVSPKTDRGRPKTIADIKLASKVCKWGGGQMKLATMLSADTFSGQDTILKALTT